MSLPLVLALVMGLTGSPSEHSAQFPDLVIALHCGLFCYAQLGVPAGEVRLGLAVGGPWLGQ